MVIGVGDTVRRVWGDGYMVTELRVSAIDDEFIYCDASRSEGAEEWESVIPEDQMPWKFDRTYGVETDEEMGWGVEPYGRNLVLTRIEANKGATEV